MPSPEHERARIAAKVGGLAAALVVAGGLGWALGAAAGPQPPADAPAHGMQQMEATHAP